MVVGLITTYAISAYHHYSYEFEWLGVLDTTLCNKICQGFATGLCFYSVSSTNKIDHHNITEIMLKVGVKHHNPNPKLFTYINENKNMKSYLCADNRH